MATPSESAEAALLRLKTVERELKTLRAEIARTDRLITLGGIAATIAHEVNNLLTPALGYAKLAQRSPERTDLAEKAIHRTVEAIEAASGILESTLDLATGTSARRAGDSGGALIVVAIERAIACLARDPKRDGIAISIDVSPDLAARIEPTALQQVFVNLFTNSSRALRQRGFGTIRVTAQGDSDAIRINFEDDGPGLPPGMAARIFEPFVTSRAPVENDPQAGGRGLGLAICRRTVEAAGGHITARDAAEGGAAFEIVVPTTDADASGQMDRPQKAA